MVSDKCQPQSLSCCRCSSSHASLIINLEKGKITLNEYTCEYCLLEEEQVDEISWYDYEFGYNYGYDYCDYYDDYDIDDFYEAISYYEDEYALGIEEEYEYKCSPKGKRGSSATSIREKLTNKAKRRPVKSCIANKKAIRIEEKSAQLKARKDRLRDRGNLTEEEFYLVHGHYSCCKKVVAVCSQKSTPTNRLNQNKPHKKYTSPYHSSSNSHYKAPGSVLSAEELGIQTGAMYDRLMEIMNGGNITPEDFDLLLQLDASNAKTTLDCEVIKELDVITVGVGLQSEVISMDARCTICLDPFKDMKTEFELRRLPCGHMFCKECIDAWLSSMSSKCPELSCYWRKEEPSPVVSKKSTTSSTMPIALPTVLEDEI